MKIEIHKHKHEIPESIAQENSKLARERWYDPRIKGSTARLFAGIAFAGVVGLLVGNNLLDKGKDDLGTVFGEKTDQIRQDIQQPINDANKARQAIESMEQDFATLRKWIEDNFGVDFESTQKD